MLVFENPAISFKNVTKMFGEHLILNDLSFDIARNKITTILGFSGAGKSTILKHILGIIQPTSGTVFVLGQDLNKLNKVELREFRRNFGMLFQYAALFDSSKSFSVTSRTKLPLRGSWRTKPSAVSTLRASRNGVREILR